MQNYDGRGGGSTSGLDVLADGSVGGDADQHARVCVDGEARRLLDAGVAREPLEAQLRAADDVFVMREIVLEQLQACRVIDGRAG